MLKLSLSPLYDNSKIGEKLKLGRIKAGATVYIHGVTKIFPLLGCYKLNTDLKTGTFDFHKYADQTASAIYRNLVTRLKERKIGTTFLTSFV